MAGTPRRQIIRTLEPFPIKFASSVYLCTSPSARHEAEEVLTQVLPDHTVLFIPKDISQFQEDVSIEAMLKWDKEAFALSDIILFWLPAPTYEEIGTFPHLHLGEWAKSGKVVFGMESSGDPSDNNLQLKLSQLQGILIENQLQGHPSLAAAASTVAQRVASATQFRYKGERKVPLHVWSTPAFKAWYRNVQKVGNRLDNASFEWCFRVGPGGVFILFWVLHVDIHVTKEGRNKSNEVVISRPDISVILAYQKAARHLDTKVVLIKEFRSPARTKDGFVHELPGGSSFNPDKDIFQTAQDELEQETGCRVGKERLRYHKSRQPGAAVTAHHAHLFSVELSAREMDVLQKAADESRAMGNAAETEVTYVQVKTLEELCQSSLVDWTTLGMIYSVL
ncbi:unnamed protein product, partial [Heterosigma akashiwo]